MSDRKRLRKDSDKRLSHTGSTHCFHCGAKLPEPELPTTAAPGTNEKIRVMQARVERGLSIDNPGDYYPDRSLSKEDLGLVV